MGRGDWSFDLNEGDMLTSLKWSIRLNYAHNLGPESFLVLVNDIGPETGVKIVTITLNLWLPQYLPYLQINP